MWLRYRFGQNFELFSVFYDIANILKFCNFFDWSVQYFDISKFSGFLISLKVGIIELFYIS